MSNDSISRKLQELFDLFKNGTITKDEYSQLKSELLDESNTSSIKGNDSIRQNDLKIVVQKTIFEDKLKDNPFNVTILQEYTQFLFNNHWFDEAMITALKLLTINENDLLTKELLFKLYIKVHRFKDALVYGEKLLQEKPTDIHLLEELARISSELGDYNKAQVYYDKILSLQPTNIAALHNKAINLLKSNQLEEAIEIFETIYLEGQSDNITTIYAGIGKALKDDHQAAIELLSPVINTGLKENNDNNINRGLLYLTYSFCNSSAYISVISERFSAIDFKLLKQNYHYLDEQTLLKTIEYLVNSNLGNNNPFISQDTESYFNNDYFTEKSYAGIANIWFTIGEKQVELKQLSQALDSIQKAIDLFPKEKSHEEKYAEIENLIKKETQKRKRKRNIIIVSVLVGLIIIVFWIISYKNIEERKAYESAKQENTLIAYQSYLDNYPNGRYVAEINELREVPYWNETKTLFTVDGYKKYLSVYPKGKYVPEANYIIQHNNESIKTREFIIYHDFNYIKNGISYNLNFSETGVVKMNFDSCEFLFRFEIIGRSINLTFLSSNCTIQGSSTTAILNSDNTISMNYKGQRLIFKPN